MSYSPLTEQLIQSLRGLPGIGIRSAQKMALHLLERDRDVAARLATALEAALESVGHCEHCRMLTEQNLCPTCADTDRDDHMLCVVESPADVEAIERAGGFNGRYFILMGHLSPINGIGPEDLGLDQLRNRLNAGGISELIIATNPTVEGDATAHFISNDVRSCEGLTVSRIAHGIPSGGIIEQVDGQTLYRALQSRAKVL